MNKDIEDYAAAVAKMVENELRYQKLTKSAGHKSYNDFLRMLNEQYPTPPPESIDKMEPTPVFFPLEP